MGAAFFFHLTRHPLERTLPILLGKARQAGWRIAVRGTDARRLAYLDEQLWMGPDDGFLPHGLSGGPHDADQPILLTTDLRSANAAECLMAVDGAQVEVDEVNALSRTCILFDGNDAKSLETARAQWKSLTAAGCSAQYWSEESGRWEKKLEK